MSASTSTFDPPSTHYLTEPYKLLSFLFGLYCDKPWSKREYETWEASEDHKTEKYSYDGYIAVYEDSGEVDSVARNVITDEVPKNEPPAGERRRNPNLKNCQELWPAAVNELIQAPRGGQAKAGKKVAAFDPERPVLSTLAGIFLAGRDSVEQIIGQAQAQANLTPAIKAQLADIIRARGASDSAPLKKLLLDPAFTKVLFDEFQQFPLVW